MYSHKPLSVMMLTVLSIYLHDEKFEFIGVSYCIVVGALDIPL